MLLSDYPSAKADVEHYIGGLCRHITKHTSGVQFMHTTRGRDALELCIQTIVTARQPCAGLRPDHQATIHRYYCSSGSPF
jgi:hypothetical protein